MGRLTVISLEVDLGDDLFDLRYDWPGKEMQANDNSVVGVELASEVFKVRRKSEPFG